MGRFVFYNPHGYWYKRTAYAHFHPQLPTYKKYQWIWDYFYKKDKYIYVYINDYETTLQGSGRKNFWKWALLNGINPLKVKLIPTIKDLNPTDIVFLFQLGNLNLQYDPFLPPVKNIEELASCRAYKVMHLTHYGYHGKIAAQYTKSAKIDLFIAESNLAKHSKIFQYYYPWYARDVFVLPFIIENRFRYLQHYDKRKNKAVATGQVLYAPNNLYEDFGIKYLHPMRKLILDNDEKLSSIIDSHIIKYNPKSEYSSPNNKKTFFHLLVQKTLTSQKTYCIRFFFKMLLAYAKLLRTQKIKAYDYDIVALLNQYKMVVHGKECMDLPPISAFEGMACGCALISEQDGFYEDLGFEEGVSYIATDGTLADLKNKIEFFRNRPDLLEQIAENGRKKTLEINSCDYMANLITYCTHEILKKNENNF